MKTTKQTAPEKVGRVDHKSVNHISGKRWFRKSAGNTYHSTTLHMKDGSQIYSGKLSGYGDQYLQTAFEMMGLRYGGTLALREELGITYSVADVERERDL